MLGLRSRKDGFRLLFPKEFIPQEIEEKYTNVLRAKHGHFITPIDFLNETLQSVDVFGFNNATVQQPQPGTGLPVMNQNRIKQNAFMHPISDFSYRSNINPITLIDKTLNVVFKHTLGYLNYFLLFETFFYQYSRDMEYNDLIGNLNVDIFDEHGNVYSRIVLIKPLINAMDMLSFNFAQPVASSETFKVEFKYSNFDLQFITTGDSEE